MMGIGTTYIECMKLKRHFIGFELYQEYIDIAMLSAYRLKNGEDPYNGLITEWRELHEKNIKTSS
jgi:DNA modification methylase